MQSPALAIGEELAALLSDRDDETHRRLLARAQRAARLGSWEWDPSTDRVVWSAELYRILGMDSTRPAPSFEDHNKLVAAEDLTSLQAAVKACIETGESYELGIRMRRSDGELRDCIAVGFRELDEAGRLVRLWGSLQDVTEQVTRQAELDASKEQTRAILATLPDYVIILKPDGTIEYANRTYPGVSLEQVIGTNIAAWIQPEHREAYRRAIEKVLANGDPVEVETQATGAGGRVVWYLTRFGPLYKDGEIVGIINVGQDITDRELARQQLANSQRLESVGLLAGGIAHDFNNYLTGIFLNISHAMGELGEHHPARDPLSDALKAMAPAQQLTHQLLTFSRGGAPVRTALNTQTWLRETCDLAMHGRSSHLVLDLPDNLPPINGDAGQLTQVVTNLLINAREAMPSGGSVYVTASFEASTTPPHIRISVRDTGIGIAPENLPRIFEPYFTTRPNGHGLGLAASYAIIQKHEGTIAATSVIGEGTEVVVMLPVCTGLAPRTPMPEAPPEQYAPLRLLIVDDEAALRHALKLVLERLGHQVHAEADGAAALLAFEQAGASGQPFQAIITDLTIPGGMGGKELAQAVRKVDPSIYLIVSSGYTADAAMSRLEEHGFNAVLPKPYSIRELQNSLAGAVARGPMPPTP